MDWDYLEEQYVPFHQDIAAAWCIRFLCVLNKNEVIYR